MVTYAGCDDAFVGFCSTLSARDHATELIAAEPAHIQNALHPGFPVWEQHRTGNLRPINNMPNPYVCRK